MELKMAGKINIRSNNNMDFIVDVELAKISDTLKTMLNNLGIDTESDEASDEASEPIPLPNINGAILKKVVEWCEHHKTDYNEFAEEDESIQPRLDNIPDWDVSFFNIDRVEIFEIINAAHYLGIKGLLNNGCKTVAKMINGKTPEQILQIFNIKNDFTPEQEEQMRKKMNGSMKSN